MHCLYINLPDQVCRRANLETNFAQYKGEGWTLERIEAFDDNHAILNGVKGRTRATEKACSLSHIEAIKQSMTSDKPVMILEDDALFGPRSCATIDAMLRILPDDDWDVLFADIGPGSASLMFELMTARRQLIMKGECKLYPLKGVFFGCATAYIINPKSREKVLAYLTRSDSFDVPYDLDLRTPIFDGTWKGWMIFPFATSISKDALTSQIQIKKTAYVDFVLSLFRMVIWADRDLAACKEILSFRAPDEEDIEADIYGKVLGTLLSEKLIKR